MWTKLEQQAERILRGFTMIIFTVLVTNVLAGVVTRYLLGNQLRWTEELATFLLVWLVFAGAALAYRAGAHLGVTVLTQSFDPAVQRRVRLFNAALVFIFCILILVVGGAGLAWERWQTGQTMPTLGISKAWVYAAAPLGGAIMAAFAAGEFQRTLRRVGAGEEEESP